MKVLVIGGTRFIGAHVVRRLHDTGADVSVLHRGTTMNPVLPKVDHIVDPGAGYPITAFPGAVRRDWDIVVHMVAMGEADARAAVETFTGHVSRPSRPLSVNSSRKPLCLRARAALFASANIYKPLVPEPFEAQRNSSGTGPASRGSFLPHPFSASPGAKLGASRDCLPSEIISALRPGQPSNRS